MLAIFKGLTPDQVLQKAQAFEVLYDGRPQVWVIGDFLDTVGGAVDLGGRHRQVLLPAGADAAFSMLFPGKEEPVAVRPASGFFREVRLLLPLNGRQRKEGVKR